MNDFRPLGLSDSQLETVKKILLANLNSFQKVDTYVFGSRSNGKFRKYSDLDLWLETSTKISEKILVDLRNALVESDLPIKVDIVTPDRCLDEYRESINKQKQLWFSK